MMKHAVLFIWLIPVLGGWATVAFFGTPHLVVSYRFHDNGDRHNPLAARHYIDCTYLGWTGLQKVPARNGHCTCFRWFKAETR
ncbi:hypothetical protein [Roseibium algae]|uniref:Secreted protein n=1 Tax=Roseibium algae TaxID=3123038 RepID=A0ABU8TR46_9HYPH